MLIDMVWCHVEGISRRVISYTDTAAARNKEVSHKVIELQVEA
jgi:hypothetical protein